MAATTRTSHTHLSCPRRDGRKGAHCASNDGCHACSHYIGQVRCAEDASECAVNSTRAHVRCKCADRQPLQGVARICTCCSCIRDCGRDCEPGPNALATLSEMFAQPDHSDTLHSARLAHGNAIGMFVLACTEKACVECRECEHA